MGVKIGMLSAKSGGDLPNNGISPNLTLDGPTLATEALRAGQ